MDSDEELDCEELLRGFDFDFPVGYGISSAGNSDQTASSAKRLMTCDQCKRPYKTLAGYNEDPKRHKMANAFRGVPDREAVNSAAVKISHDVFVEMSKDIPKAGMVPALLRFVEDLKSEVQSTEWTEFTSFVIDRLMEKLPNVRQSPRRGQTYPMPGEVRTVFMKGLASLLTKNDPLAILERQLEKLYKGDTDNQ